MARITVEDCIDKVEGPYDLVLIAKERAVQLNSGEQPKVDPEDDKNRVTKWNELDKKSKARLADLVKNKLKGPFGLGSDRTIEEFGKLSGVDLIKKDIVDFDRATNTFCFFKIDSDDRPFHSIISVNN